MATSPIDIYCPSCHWEPDGGAYWQCRYRWSVTTCPPQPGGCGVTSPHLDWYHGLDALIEELVEAALPVAQP